MISALTSADWCFSPFCVPCTVQHTGLLAGALKVIAKAAQDSTVRREFVVAREQDAAPVRGAQGFTE